MLTTHISDRIGWLKMDDGKVNAMDLEWCTEFSRQVAEMAGADIDALIISGNARAFSAGIDLKRWLAEPPSYVAPFLAALEDCFERVFCFPKPTVSLIASPAIAGGCMVAAACDRRLIDPEATIGIPEMRIGVPLPMTAIEIMRFVAPGAFEKVVLGGARFQGAEAIEVGLATHLVARSEQPAIGAKMAGELAEVPAETYAFTKRQTRDPALTRRDQNRAALHADYLRIWESPTTRAAIDRYVRERLGSKA